MQYRFSILMSRIFKYGDIPDISFTPDKELNILIYKLPSYLIIYRSHILYKMVLFFLAHPVYALPWIRVMLDPSIDGMKWIVFLPWFLFCVPLPLLLPNPMPYVCVRVKVYTYLASSENMRCVSTGCRFWYVIRVFEQRCQFLHHRTKMSQWLGKCRCCLQGLWHCPCHRQAAARCTVHQNWSLHMPTLVAPMSTANPSSWTVARSVADRSQHPLQVSAVMDHCTFSTHTVRHFLILARIWARPCPMSRWRHRATTFVNRQDDRAAYMVKNICHVSLVWSLVCWSCLNHVR